MTSRPPRRRAAALALAIALPLAGAPAAWAQSGTTQAGGPSLSPAPPVSLHQPSSSHSSTHHSSTHHSSSTSSTRHSSASRTSTRTTRLPNTGYDAWAVALLGAGLMAAGIGLRLRTRDVGWP